MNLTKNHLKLINTDSGVELPDNALLELPEKVLQFGAGVFLRALPDYIIDKANKQGLFNGRVVVVKSTSQGSSDEFEKQDGLYTICVRGYDKGQMVNKYILNASISRVLAASESWEEILMIAGDPKMEVIISNTTEAGIVLVADDVSAAPPKSFPGKLLAFLHRRYQLFKGDKQAGMVILPTELITDNGTKLKEILVSLADQNKLDKHFVEWLVTANDFCNNLVDRIVPGKLPTADKEAAERHLAYRDDLMIMSEAYSLWAIETTSESTRRKLAFASCDEGVVITSDISKFKELKLRLLNGSHSFCCGIAILAGFQTVKEAMENESFYNFISNLMFDEIVPAITTADVPEEDARSFASSVLDRYRNPFIEHKWLSITLQYTMKMKMRNVPTIFRYHEKAGAVPEKMAKGFAAYILFMRSSLLEDGTYAGKINNTAYTISDQFAPVLHEKWQSFGGMELVNNVLADESLWERSLLAIPGFAAMVYKHLCALQEEGSFSDAEA